MLTTPICVRQAAETASAAAVSVGGIAAVLLLAERTSRRSTKRVVVALESDSMSTAVNVRRPRRYIAVLDSALEVRRHVGPRLPHDLSHPLPR